MKLTKRAVDGLRAPADKDAVCWDDDLRGFGLRLKPSGVRSYLIQYRVNGRSRRFTIGKHGELTPEQARDMARKHLGHVREGGDPAAEREFARQAETVAELCDRYLKHHAEVRKKSTSLRNDRANIRDYIEKSLGGRKVADITRADVVKLHHTFKDRPYAGNRVLALLSKMMNLAEKWGIRPDGSNPCRHVEKFKERKRQRFLLGAELASLGKVLAEVERERRAFVATKKKPQGVIIEHPSAVPCIRLLLFTGARLSEILTLRWEYVDLERQCLNLPDSKTGAKVIHLNPGALEVLVGLERDGSPWVLRGRTDENHLVNLEKPWRRIRKRAGLPDVRLHDLRHTFASMGVGGGASLAIVGALLGHTQPATTARYAHLSADPLKEATNAIGASLQAALNPTPDAAKIRKVK